MRVCLLTILLWAVLWTFGKAQEFKVTYTQIGVEEGLAGSAVYCAFQDKDGYIWFGTETGVSRYNGKRFENFSTSEGLADNEVFKIVQDKLGRIWFSAFNGQLSYFYQEEFYNATNDPFLANVKVTSHFNDLLVDAAGTVWISTILDGIITIKPSGEIYYYAENLGKGGLSMLLRKVGNSVKSIHSFYGDIELKEDMPSPDRLPDSAERDQLFSELFDAYLPTKEAQLIRSIAIFQQYALTLVNGEKFWESEITKTHHYGDETWFCTYSGAYRLDSSTPKEVSNYFKDYMVTHVLKDREGSYWFTTLGNGIFYVSSLASQSIRNEQSDVMTGISALRMTEDETVLFAGNNGTFGYIREGSIYTDQMKSPRNRTMVKKIEEGFEENQFFLGSDNALIEVVDSKIKRSVELLAKTVLKWKEDLYAIGTSSRLLLVDRDQLEAILNLTEQELADSDLEKYSTDFTRYISPGVHWITDLEPYEDGLLLGTLAGVYYMNAQYEIAPVEGHELLQKRVNDISILGIDGGFAVATHGYGILIKSEKGWRSVTEKEGLRSAISRKIWHNHPDTLWVASNEGVDRIVLSDEIKIRNVTQSDGLVNQDVYDVLVSGEQLVAATSGGISLVDLPKWRQGKVPPLIGLKSVSVDGLISSGDSVQIAFDNRETRIEYDGIHFSSLEKLSYRYRMLGEDDVWQTTPNNGITFGRLLPGTYTFEVQAINADQVLSKETASIILVVTRPFWWQLWFIIAAPLALIILIILLTRYYVEKSRMKTQRELEVKLQISETERRLLKAQVKPHFTYNILNSIQGMILKEETDKAYEFMGEFAALMRKDLDAYDQNSISLKEELELLESYLKLEKLRFQDNEWDYEIVLDEGISSDLLQVPPMFLQPFVENTIKHGFAEMDYPGKILIRGYGDEKHLNFEVVDNGIGLRSGTKTTYASKGIAIVRKRLELINDMNKVIINDREDGHGVRVSIQMTL